MATRSLSRGQSPLLGQGWSRAWPSRAAHQSPPLSFASLVSLVLFTQPQTLCGHLAKVLRPLHAQLWLLRLPAFPTSHPALTTNGTPSSTPTALLRLLTAQQPPSPSRPTPLELVGAPVTSAAAACARPPSAPCGERSERPPPFLRAVRNLEPAAVFRILSLSCLVADCARTLAKFRMTGGPRRRSRCLAIRQGSACWGRPLLVRLARFLTAVGESFVRVSAR